MQRRQFLWTSLAAAVAGNELVAATREPQGFATRGVVLYPFDLTLTDWPARVAQAGLNTIGLHAARRLDVLVKFVQSDTGQKFLEQCGQLGVHVEYELHAMGDLLSREYFGQDETMFRQDAGGQRNADFNCCPSHPRALELIAEAAVEFGRLLRPTTHRYFYWPDDGREWCHCDKCRGLCSSEQALLVEHAMLRALRKHVDPEAAICHIAYGPTLEPPKQVQPEPGVFLEFAPIRRRHDRPFEQQTDLPAVDRIEMLDGNLEVFPRETAQVLEYWLDVSRLSGWKRPVVKLPWYQDVLIADLASYRRRGIRHITSFACFIDAEYLKLHGDPQAALADYGQTLGS
ncbi:MAG: DUF4838 domain-containing protein [Pirellulaceae bacterium]